MKQFGDTAAVKGLNLTIREGEFLTLLGPSGFGKPTTLRCIAGLQRPSAGAIRLAPRRLDPRRPGAPTTFRREGAG